MLSVRVSATLVMGVQGADGVSLCVRLCASFMMGPHRVDRVCCVGVSASFVMGSQGAVPVSSVRLSATYVRACVV